MAVTPQVGFGARRWRPASPVRRNVPRTPPRTLKKRAADVLAHFDRPGTSNGPTEAINDRLEHLRGSALGFRSLTNYIARSLLETGGFRPQLHTRPGPPVRPLPAWAGQPPSTAAEYRERW
ncbi:hypothetical protein GCM10009579_37070 [Streptomyces javensis]|uniref:Transposase IS204/IS1001/IS1096/IS1165 DDE domain-containing protein n=1 Tax=Streptomyces javensis TaxID=114698 RepID=A0ABP4HRE2_9ACTN